MNKSPEVTKERLMEEFGAVVGETEQFLKSVATAGGDKRDAVRAGIDERLADAGDRLAKIRDESMRQVTAAARSTDDYVQGNPWRSVGIAVGVATLAGLVAGLLIARR